MLIKSAEQITHISDIPEINSQNYFELISMIDNLYNIINILKPVIPIHDAVFQPTFKGKYTCEKFNINSTSKENELKVFAIKTTVFLEDEDNVRKEMLIDILENLCEENSIRFNEDLLEFVLI